MKSKGWDKPSTYFALMDEEESSGMGNQIDMASLMEQFQAFALQLGHNQAHQHDDCDHSNHQPGGSKNY